MAELVSEQQARIKRESVIITVYANNHNTPVRHTIVVPSEVKNKNGDFIAIHAGS